MKKYLALACALSCASMFTACHDDGDEDGNVVGDFGGAVSVMNMPAQLATVMDNMAAQAYLYSDGNVSLFTFESGYSDNNPIYNLFQTGVVEYEGDTTGVSEDYVGAEKTAVGLEDYSSIYESEAGSWFGGFMPTWDADLQEEDAADFVMPIDSTYANNVNCLIANPGTVCRALFMKNLTSPMAHLMMKKAIKLDVQANRMYKYLADATSSNESVKADALANLDAWGVSPLPANIRIEAVVYGYVDHFRITSFKTALKELKEIGANFNTDSEVGKATLIETDENGKVISLCDHWTEIKFSKQSYLNEVYIRAIDKTTGKTSKTFTFDDGECANSLLNFVLVDKITFEGRSLF